MAIRAIPFRPFDVAELPTRVQSSQQYLTEAVELLHAGDMEGAAEKIRYVRDRMLPHWAELTRRTRRNA